MGPRTVPLFIRSDSQANPPPNPYTDQGALLRPGALGTFGNQWSTLQDPLTGRLANVFAGNAGSITLSGVGPGTSGLAVVGMTYGYRIGVDNIIDPIDNVLLSGSFAPAGVRGLATSANLYLFDGANQALGRTGSDAADDQANAGNVLLAALARLQGFDGATWDRLRTGSAATLAALSAAGALLTTRPGDWSVNQTPAANTQATITRAAGAAGVRHVCTSISARILDPSSAINGTFLVNLRDGATGAGTILWSTRLMLNVTLLGNQVADRVELSGLNIPGTAATAMTLEFAAAGGAATFESVAMTGYDAPA